MDTFTEDQLDPGIVVVGWQGPQPNFSTYGILPPRNRWFAERLLRHFRSIHKQILAPHGHIPKAMIRELIAASPNGREMLGYDPQPQAMLAGTLLAIEDFHDYSDRDEYRGIISELAWRAPIYAGGDPQAEILFWRQAKKKCREFFQQAPNGATEWNMTEDQFLQYADDTIASLETELKESSIPQETSIRQARPELQEEPKMFREQSNLSEEFKTYIGSSHYILTDGRIDWQGSMNNLAFIARHLWYDKGAFGYRSVFDKARRYFVFKGNEIDQKAFSRAFHKDEVKYKDPKSFGLSP